jgi:ParB family chromosome partitioning protein
MSQEQTAKIIGKSQSAVANKLRILKHSPEVLQALRKGELTERHARALLTLPGEEEKLRAIAVIVAGHMSVAQTERYIRELLAGPRKRESAASVRSFLKTLTQTMEKIQSSGIPAVSERRETDTQIVFTITIPK